MGRWIETEDGEFVNLDHAVRISPQDKVDGKLTRHFFRITLTDGDRVNSVGTWGGPYTPPDELLGETLPAAPDAVAIVAAVDYEPEDGRPKTVSHYEYQILGWRIPLQEDGIFANPIPILIQRKAEGETVLLPLPNDRYLEAGFGGTEFDSFAEALQRVLEREQDVWDQDHAAEDTAA